MLKHAKVSAVVDDPAADIKPSHWNEEHVADADGLKMVASTSTPSVPASGFLKLFARLLAGGALPAYSGPSGLDSALQPFLARNKIFMWQPNGNATTMTQIGCAAPLVTTATARNVATTNLFTSLRRLGSVSAATAGSPCGIRGGIALFCRGNAAGVGGFRAVFRFGMSDAATVAGARSFIGMYSGATQIGNVNPSTLLNIVGVGHDDTDSNLQIIYNDGSGAASKIDLGANFPANTLSVDAYELALFCPPNGSDIGYEVTRLNTGDVARGTLTSDLPANTTYLAPQMWRNNGATALAVGIDMIGLYIETDN